MTSVTGCVLRRLSAAWLPLVMAAAAAGIVAAAEAQRIESAWSAEPPAIDGHLNEWSAPLVSAASQPLSIGVRNDAQFLYVAIAASDPSARMLLGAAGFTLWWDPAGKEKKSAGISIPPTMAGGRGMRGRGGFGEPPDDAGQPPDRQGTPPERGREGQENKEGQPPGGRGGPALQPIGHIEMVGAGKDERRRLELAYARTIGLDVASSMSEGVLIYELRVPLPASESQPYAVRSAPGSTIGLGIESNQMPRPEGRGEEGRGRHGGMGGGPPGGGGMGGMGGGMGGGGRGMGGGGREGGSGGMREMKPIKAWAVVHLAKGPA
jgi:hypothetical protein